MNKFESINIGDRAELKHKITQDDINKFVDLTGDDNKLHIDEAYAKTTSFKKPVAHGMLSASFISTIIGTKLPGDGALWFSQNIEFHLPVRVGDEITIIAEVVKKVDRNNSIELTTDIFNQNKEKVTSGLAKVKIIEKETPASDESAVVSEKKKRTVLVIGGTGGIGRAACIQLAEDGFAVAIHYNRNHTEAKRIEEIITSKGGMAMLVNADITKADEVLEMVSKVMRKFEYITALVNCSTSHIPNIKFSDLSWADIQSQIDIGVKGTFNLLQAVVPHMTEQAYGKIINMTTMSIEKPSTSWTHYITAKSALHGFSNALAVELAPKGIMLNLISPGMTDTDLVANLPEKVKLLTAAQTPLRRIASPKDIAGVISFLASEKSDYLAGETIRVNGGQVMI
jgi:3-oxoacyl-[acyl-carrier protein] reductase